VRAGHGFSSAGCHCQLSSLHGTAFCLGGEPQYGGTLRSACVGSSAYKLACDLTCRLTGLERLQYTLSNTPVPVGALPMLWSPPELRQLSVKQPSLAMVRHRPGVSMHRWALQPVMGLGCGVLLSSRNAGVQQEWRGGL